MGIKENIKFLRELHDLSQKDLALIAGVSDKAVSTWEQGIKEPRMGAIQKIADHFNLKKSDIIEDDGLVRKSNIQPTTSSVYPYIPESVAAGLPTNINAMTTLPYISVPDVLMGRYAGAKGILFMRVNGESMNKVIPNQAYIAIDTRITLHDLKDGNIVVFVDEFDGYSVKRFFRMQNRLVFRPESDNHDYFDLAFKETDNIRIVGRVVTYIVNLE